MTTTCTSVILNSGSEVERTIHDVPSADNVDIWDDSDNLTLFLWGSTGTSSLVMVLVWQLNSPVVQLWLAGVIHNVRLERGL